MNARWLSMTVAVALLFITAMGCSSDGAPVMTIPDTNPVPGHSGAGRTLTLGLWQVVIDKATSEVDVVQLRGVEDIVNVLSFMEPPPLKNLSIDFNTLDIDGANNYIGVDVLFTHPFVTPNNDFMGFDVRGVVFGPEIQNADAYSPLMNPADFFGVPFGYIDGLLGTPNIVGDYDEEFWGYKYFCDGLGLNDDLVDFYSNPINLGKRGAFGEGETNRRHYDLKWGSMYSGYGFFVFNYAVVASYDWPVGEPPYNQGNFPITSANMAEAFCLTAYEVSNGLYHDGTVGGGSIDFDIEVWDWQGLGDTKVTVESMESGILGPVTVDTYDPGSTAYSGIYHFVEVDGNPLATGPIDLLITATDESETYGSAWFLGVLPTGNPFYNDFVYTLQIFTVNVAGQTPELEMYWYPVEGQTGNPMSPPPNQGARDPDLGVYNLTTDQSRGTTLHQNTGLFNFWNDGYTAGAGNFNWYWGAYYSYLPETFDDVNHFDRTVDGSQVQIISYNQNLYEPGNIDMPNSSVCAMLDTATGFFPDDYVIWLPGLDPSTYWLDFGDVSSAIVGYDESPNGADDNMYFIGSYSTRSDNPSLYGPWDGNYYFYRWLDPYIEDLGGGNLNVPLDGIAVWGLSTQTPSEDGLLDTEPRLHRLGVDDNTGVYFTEPSHPATDYAEFFYIIDNGENLHMCILEFDDPIAFISIGWVLPAAWEGATPVDVEVAPGYTATELTPSGWSEVLLDNGDNTWTILTLWWDISNWPDELAVYILDQTDAFPGIPLALDIDNDDFEMHVLARNGSSVEATVFKWYDNYDQ